MRFRLTTTHQHTLQGPALTRLLLVATVLSAAAASARAQSDTAADPRVGLGAGWMDAKQAIRNLRLTAHVPRPEGFVDAQNPGDFGLINSDLAFQGNFVFQGNFHGFQVWDISKPSSPTLRTAFVCPGGQGDVSVYHNLLFVSVEETDARIDCGTQGVPDTVSAERFRGVRIFDITDIGHPKQVAAVQTCRGSHTNTLITDPKDTNDIYIYVSGTSPARSPNELAGCSGPSVTDSVNSSYFRIDVIRVPLAAPQNARIVADPRIFADSAGRIASLWKGGDHGPGTQNTEQTNMCHDITAYAAIGLAAGACSGNGILLDIRDPANPKRVAQVVDPNFAYWHSATFSNDGSKVLFTDEWGGGVAPHCRASDPANWGADAIFTRAGNALRLAGYYKLPATQTDLENCVAHNGSLIPVPGRDIMVQAWYQGGISVFDFADPTHPKEIAFFDRGPMDSTKLVLGGYWSAYWYNGHIVASEIGRGLDVFDLAPSEYLTQNEIDAAKSVTVDVLNPQNQQKIVWPATFVLARAYLDQLVRDNGLDKNQASGVATDLARAEGLAGRKRHDALHEVATLLDRDARLSTDAMRVRTLASTVRDLASTAP
jgi:hypothetical protein